MIIRTGRHNPCTLYAQYGPDPSDQDEFIGSTVTPRWAAELTSKPGKLIENPAPISDEEFAELKAKFSLAERPRPIEPNLHGYVLHLDKHITEKDAHRINEWWEKSMSGMPLMIVGPGKRLSPLRCGDLDIEAAAQRIWLHHRFPNDETWEQLDESARQALRATARAALDVKP